jgi:hypothetical protein
MLLPAQAKRKRAKREAAQKEGIDLKKRKSEF